MNQLSKMWTPAPKLKVQDRYSLDLFGAGGSGKTHFVINSAPGPILLVNFDRDPSRMIAASGRDDIYVCSIHTAGLWLTDEEARKKYANLEAALKDATKMESGTFAIDGGSALTHLLEQIALADYNAGSGREAVERLPSLMRGGINSRILNLCAVISQTPVNFIITHQVREVWAKDAQTGNVGPTGRYEARENTQIEYGVDLSMYMFTQWQSAAPPATEKVLKHYGKVVICKHSQGLVNQRFENPTFDLVVGMMEG